MEEQNEQQQQQQQRRRHQLDSASRSAQDMMDSMLETEDRAVGSAAATAVTTNNESSRTGVTDVVAPDQVSSNIEEAQRSDVPNSKDASNTGTVALPTFSVRGDDQPTKSNENSDDDQQLHWPTEHKEHTDRKSTAVRARGDDQPTKSDENLDDEQQLHRPTEHKEHTDRKSTAVIEAGHGSLLPPSYSSVLVKAQQQRQEDIAERRLRHTSDESLHSHNESIIAEGLDVEEQKEEQQPVWRQRDLVNVNDEEQQRRQAEFAARRRRHDSDDSLQAHYDAIFAAARQQK